MNFRQNIPPLFDAMFCTLNSKVTLSNKGLYFGTQPYNFENHIRALLIDKALGS